MKEVHTENVGSLELFISIYQLQLKQEQDVLFQKLIFVLKIEGLICSNIENVFVKINIIYYIISL